MIATTLMILMPRRIVDITINLLESDQNSIYFFPFFSSVARQREFSLYCIASYWDSKEVDGMQELLMSMNLKNCVFLSLP